MNLQMAGLSCVAILFSASTVLAQSNPPQSGAPVIRTSAAASVSAQPDQARIVVGVVSRATDARDAADANKKDVNRLLEALRGALGPGAELETLNYSIYPERQFIERDRRTEITGYTATNTVQATLDDIAKVGSVLDLAAKSGANQIQGVEFRLKDEGAARAEALRGASAEARKNAEALADALSVRIVRILSVEQQAPASFQPYRAAMADAALEASPVPIEPRPVQIEATVNLTFEIEEAR